MVFFLNILLLSLLILNSKEQTIKFGLNYNNLHHSGNVIYFNNKYTSNGIFNNSYSENFSSFLNYHIKLNHYFGINFNSEYQIIDGKFLNSRYELLNFDGKLYDGEFQYNLKYKWDNFNIGLGLDFYLFDNFTSSINYSYQISIANSEFEGWEELSKPKDIGYLIDSTGNRVRRRNHFNQPIKQNDNSFLSINLEYSIPLFNKNKIFLVPKLTYNYYFSEVLDEWQIQGFSIGLGLSYKFYSNKEDYPIYKSTNLDKNLFVSAVPLSNQLTVFEKLIKTVTNTKKFSFNDVSKNLNLERIDTTINYNFPGIKFLYNFNHINDIDKVWIDLWIDDKKVKLDLIDDKEVQNLFENNKEINSIKYSINVVSRNTLYYSELKERSINTLIKNNFNIELKSEEIDDKMLNEIINVIKNNNIIIKSDKNYKFEKIKNLINQKISSIEINFIEDVNLKNTIIIEESIN